MPPDGFAIGERDRRLAVAAGTQYGQRASRWPTEMTLGIGPATLAIRGHGGHAFNRAYRDRRWRGFVRLSGVAPDDGHDVLPLRPTPDPPAHVRPEDYEEWVIARRKRRRLIKTVAAALVGAAIGWLLFTMIGSGLGAAVSGTTP